MKLKYNIINLVGKELRIVSFDNQDDYYEMWVCELADCDTKKEKYDYFKSEVKQRIDHYSILFPFLEELNNISLETFKKIIR
jgi:hypothetical protein